MKLLSLLALALLMTGCFPKRYEEQEICATYSGSGCSITYRKNVYGEIESVEDCSTQHSQCDRYERVLIPIY